MASEQSDRRKGPRPATLAKRQSIIEAASQVFGEKGYSSGSLTEVAQKVGVTHAGILHHFGSKEKLLMAVLAYRDEIDLVDTPAKRMPEGEELLRHLIQTAVNNEQRAGIVQAFAIQSAESVQQDHPTQPHYVQRYQGLRASVTRALLCMAGERGIEPVVSVHQASAAILAVMDGMQIQWLLEPEQVSLAQATQQAIEAIVSAVMGEPWSL